MEEFTVHSANTDNAHMEKLHRSPQLRSKFYFLNLTKDELGNVEEVVSDEMCKVKLNEKLTVCTL